MTIEKVKTEFKAFQDAYADKETSIEEVKGDDGSVLGVRLLLVVAPSIQFIYVPSTMPEVAVMVYPGDDAAVSSKIVSDMAYALRDVARVRVIGVIGANFTPMGANFTYDRKEVYELWRTQIKATAEQLLETEAAQKPTSEG